MSRIAQLVSFTTICWSIGILAASLGLVSCGGNNGYGSGPPKKPPSSSHPTPTKLRILYRVLPGGTDRMTSFGPEERSMYPSEGQMYYVADQLGADRAH
jgi:hypothetical protein